jgi:hypothetical protein
MQCHFLLALTVSDEKPAAMWVTVPIRAQLVSPLDAFQVFFLLLLVFRSLAVCLGVGFFGKGLWHCVVSCVYMCVF